MGKQREARGLDACFAAASVKKEGVKVAEFEIDDGRQGARAVQSARGARRAGALVPWQRRRSEQRQQHFSSCTCSHINWPQVCGPMGCKMIDGPPEAPEYETQVCLRM